jgi:hypothetical protein
VTVFSPSELEMHLLVDHGVDSRLMADVHSSPHSVNSDEVAEISHRLMHAAGAANHNHTTGETNERRNDE